MCTINVAMINSSTRCGYGNGKESMCLYIYMIIIKLFNEWIMLQNLLDRGASSTSYFYRAMSCGFNELHISQPAYTFLLRSGFEIRFSWFDMDTLENGSSSSVVMHFVSAYLLDLIEMLIKCEQSHKRWHSHTIFILLRKTKIKTSKRRN